MDGVSGLADESKKFAAFLSVTRKYNYNCVYIFHTVFPEKSNWRLILSQTNIFNIFPASVPINSVRKILEGACSRKTQKYILQNAFWFNRLFFDLANTNDKICLTIDSSSVNKDGPGRFRTKADNPEFQVCYFNSKNNKQVYNEFISQIINNDENENDFHFKIVRQKSKTNKNVTFESSEELNNLKENDSASSRSEKRARKAFGIRSSSSNLFYGEGTDEKSADNSSGRTRKRTKPRFLHWGYVVHKQNIIAKKDIKAKKFYSFTKYKAQNFLTNLSYKLVKKDELLNENFTIDCISFILFYLNPFYLEWKFDDAVDRDKVETLWICFIPNEFYFYICLGENYQLLNNITLKYNTANKIVCDHINQYRINSLTTFFKQYADVYQFIYSTLFPKYFCRIDNDAIQSRCLFETAFVNFKAQKTALI